METKNAKITDTMLGYEDHGLLSSFVHLDYGGSGQGFGGYNLNGEATDQWVRGVLQTVGVLNWEDLKGKHVRVKTEDGWNGKIVAIGHIIEDKWFNPSELWKN